MITLVMSAVILLLPIAVSIFLWYLGLMARCCLVVMCLTGILEVDAVINPDKGIREKYEQLLKQKDQNTIRHCAG